MKCEDISALMADYLQGALPAGQSAGLELHIAHCEKCTAEVTLWSKLGTLPEDQPSPALRSRFDAMLASYQEGRWEKKSLTTERNKFFDLRQILDWLRTPAFSMGWAMALLIGGFLAGHYFDRPAASNGVSPQEVASLHEELRSMRQLVVISMLQQQSASERLQGVSYSRAQADPDPKVLNALLHTMRYDNSVDVRLAALDALSHYGARQDVRKGLMDSLQEQQSPLVQVALIDVLVDWHEATAVDRLKRLQQDPRTDPSVRKRADWGIQQLS
ncbi:MAG TPA: zf-HC2 domain-containing protein [Terriglobales bacterium]|nr:zf-HC2 domain-containing protein [Terriglobales bacterium]